MRTCIALTLLSSGTLATAAHYQNEPCVGSETQITLPTGTCPPRTVVMLPFRMMDQTASDMVWRETSKKEPFYQKFVRRSKTSRHDRRRHR